MKPIEASWVAGAASDYERGEIVHWPGWRGLIGWDVFLNNLCAGTLVATTLAVWVGGANALAAPGLSLALLILIADLLVLIADLGDPWRFHHMLRVMRPASPMSVGVWSLSSMGVLLGLAFVLAWLPWPAAQAAARWLMLAASLPALGVLVYKGVLFSCTSQPGLRDARWLSAHLASSGLLLGVSALGLLAGLLDSPARAGLHAMMLVLLIPAGLSLWKLASELAPRACAAYSAGQRRGLAWLVLGLGGIVPMLLLLLVPGPRSMEGAGVLLLLGGIVLRQAVIRLAEPLQ